MKTYIGAALTLALAAQALPSRAEVYSISVYTVKAHYEALPPVCTDPNQTPEHQYRQVADLWTGQNRRGDNEALYICTIKAALGGYAPAQTRLGQLYSIDVQLPIGHTAPQHPDMAAALYWFEKAADNGDAHGAALAAQLIAAGGEGSRDATAEDDAKAADLYARAIKGGYGQAAKALEALKNRDARIADFDTRYGAKAAAGDGAALTAYAVACITGDPLRYSPVKAADYARRAAEAGNPDGQSLWGALLIQGLGVTSDSNAAIPWLIKAAEGGNHSRDYYVTNLYDDPATTAANRTAIEAAAKGTLRDSISGQIHLSVHPQVDVNTGGLATVDMSNLSLEAVTKLANTDGDDAPDAQVNLAARYSDGTGVKPDPVQARRWLLKAAVQNSDANMNLGDMAYTDVPSDPAAAADYYAIAAVMGDPVGAGNAVKLYRSLNQPVKAYAAAIAVWRLDVLPPSDDVHALDGQMSFEDKARALEYLNEQRLAHYRWFK